MRKAFPDVQVLTLCMVLHPANPDFELYQVHATGSATTTMKLEERMIRKNSIDFTDELRENLEALLTLPAKLDNDLFRGLPPLPWWPDSRHSCLHGEAATRIRTSTRLERTRSDADLQGRLRLHNHPR